ncbi:MAG: DUF4105 domain-containing protein [Gemmatimonadaceae bacterium]|nr:DUF4105 domain-containing protein [Gemmatimonadaceae bacterium]
MNFRNCLLIGALFSSANASVATAQNFSATPTPIPGEELTVYLMTMGPGDAIFEKFGHTAIWIHDAARQRDVAYNWGLFDFNDKDFIARLARGRMRYSMAGFEMRAMLQLYIDQKRSVWAQELNLSPQQRLQVQSLAEINALPENRYYTYDYYLNNCSTLPRDIIDKVLTGGIKAQTDSVFTNTTFRSHTLRLLADDKLAYTGAEFSLGHAADVNLTQWQEMFLPLKLRDHLRKVSVSVKSGRAEPLVVRELDLAASSRPADRVTAPNYAVGFAIFGFGIATLFILLLWLSVTGLRTTKTLLRFTASLWCVVAGLAGLALILAWTVTNHVFMRGNENILQLNPLLLLLGVLIPFAFKVVRVRRTVMGLAFTCAGLSVLGFFLQVLPALDQPNGEIIGLAMPVQVALAFVCWFLFSERMKRARL